MSMKKCFLNNVDAKKKNIQYEYVRAFAIIAVITIHTFYSAILQFGDMTSSRELVIFQIVMNLMWWAVPCFLMLSGSLLLDSNKKISLKKLYGKYIARMMLTLFTFGFVYAWMELFFESHTISLVQIITAFGRIFTGDLWAHMWYIYCLIGLYVLLPVYKLVADHATDEELKYILLVLFVFGAVFRLTKIWGFELGFYCHVATIYPFWFLLGAAQNRKILKLRKRTAALFAGAGSFVLIILTILGSKGVSLEVLFGYDSVFVAIQSLGVFGLIVGMKERKTAILTLIADKSFGIYLVHMFFINMAYKLVKLNPFSIDPALLAGILFVMLNLILSYGVVWILEKMPVLRKIV